VALWNSDNSRPNGIEIEVMDMIYGLRHRDWLKLDSGPESPIAEEEDPDRIADRGDESKKVRAAG
jgi:beta-lactamase class C